MTFPASLNRRTFLTHCGTAAVAAPLSWQSRAQTASQTTPCQTPAAAPTFLSRLQPAVLGGGFIRAAQVARLAAAAGVRVVPHMSGGGLGYLDVVQFASFTPNIGEFMESKGNTGLPVACATSSLKCERGIVRCPAGVGFGVTIDPAFVTAAKPVETNAGAAE